MNTFRLEGESSSTLEGLLHVGHSGCGVVSEQSVHGHDDPRSAEPTLRAVSPRYSLLETNTHIYTD